MARCVQCGNYAPQKFCSPECRDARGREMMWMRLEGRTLREVGKQFGISAGAASTGIDRAARRTLTRLKRTKALAPCVGWQSGGKTARFARFPKETAYCLRSTRPRDSVSPWSTMSQKGSFCRAFPTAPASAVSPKPTRSCVVRWQIRWQIFTPTSRSSAGSLERAPRSFLEARLVAVPPTRHALDHWRRPELALALDGDPMDDAIAERGLPLPRLFERQPDFEPERVMKRPARTSRAEAA
jgi:hypothetical protein